MKSNLKALQKTTSVKGKEIKAESDASERTVDDNKTVIDDSRQLIESSQRSLEQAESILSDIDRANQLHD